MKYQEFIDKHLPELDKLDSFAKKVYYCNNLLQFLGTGSGRRVYKFDDDFVIKLAKNVKGIAQNNDEIDVSKDHQYDDYITKIVEFDSDEYMWVISEYAKKITRKRFKQLLGYEMYEFYYYVSNFVNTNNGRGRIINVKYDEITLKNLENSDFVRYIIDMCLSYDVSVGDFDRPTSFGEVNRHGNPQVVVVDYGLSNQTYNTYYNKFKSIYEKYSPDKEEHKLFELNEIKERYERVMKGAKYVKPKKKCIIGSKEICNRGDINNWNIFETINPDEAYTHEGSISTILDGKRDLAFVSELSNEERYVLGDNNIGILPVNQNNKKIVYILYRDKKKANRLKEIADMYNGFLPIKNPETVYEVGILLGYDENSVISFINKKFGGDFKPNNLDEEFLGLHKFKYAPRMLGIYKNPKSIKNFDFYTRAICDKNGDLFVVEDSGVYLTHLDIANRLKSLGHDFKYTYKDFISGDFIFLQRLGGTSKMFFSESYTKNLINNKIEHFSSIIDKCKEKNPSITFVLAPINDYTSEEPRIVENMNEGKVIGLNELPFIDEVKRNGGNIYSVGGAVRDEYLGKESKDLDILVTGIPFENLEKILSKYGRVDSVGKSFGILKVKIDGYDEDIDVALPRTEEPTGEGGHKGFVVKSDHNLSIKDDLYRRDFTINAIAKDISGKVIDPYGGVKDLKNKIIRVVNPEAFIDDPLRMLRAVQFAARFGFRIDDETRILIQTHAKKIKEISPERILGELDKIVQKGNPYMGAMLLKSLYLTKNIFGTDNELLKNPDIWNNIKTLGEYITVLSFNLVDDPAEFYKKELKGDIETYKEIKALQYNFLNRKENDIMRITAHNMYLISPKSLKSKIISKPLQRACEELLSGKYPKKTTDLAVNGNDIMSLGFKGQEISKAQKMLLILIYADEIKNEKEELINSLKKSKGLHINEDITSANLNYYRAVDKYLGDNVEFTPNGYYEMVDDDGNPVFKYDMNVRSKTKELSASKFIGGAIMGLYSMYLNKGKNPTTFYIYEINEKPDVDISHWRGGDFELLQEVRYRKPVKGKYIGKINLSDDFIKILENYYFVVTLDPYDEEENDEKIEKFKNTDYMSFLTNLKNKLT